MAGRVTDVVAEVLRTGGQAARATAVAAEVLRAGTPHARLTEVVAEVLRATHVGETFDLAATTGLKVGSAGLRAAAVGPKPVAAATHLVVGSIASPPPPGLDQAIASDSHLTLQYRLAEASGTVAAESVAGVHDGTYAPAAGSITYHQAGPGGAPAVKFTGGATMTASFPIVGLAANPSSVEFWFKLDALPATASTLFQLSDSGGGPVGNIVAVDNLGRISFRATSSTTAVVNAGAVTTGVWHQVWAATNSGGGLDAAWLWLDGVFVAEVTYTGGSFAGDTIRLGTLGATDYAAGHGPAFAELATYDDDASGAASRALPHYLAGTATSFFKSASTFLEVQSAADTAVAHAVVYTRSATTGLAIENQESHRVNHLLPRSATTGLELRHNASYPTLAAATTGLSLAHAATGRKATFHAATTGLDLVHAAPAFKFAQGLASSGIALGPGARDPDNPNVFVIAATGIDVADDPVIFFNRAWDRNAETRVLLGLAGAPVRALLVSAATGLKLGSLGLGHGTTQVAAATTGLALGLAPSAHVPASLLVAARSGLAFGLSDVTTTTAVFVRAATGLSFRVEGVVAGLNLALSARAATSLVLASDADVGTSRSYRPVATSRVNLGLRATITTTSRAFVASAATGIDVGAFAADAAFRAFAVHAQAGLSFGVLGTAVRAAVAAGSTGLALAHAPAVVGRIYHVSAVTAMALARDEDNNQFLRPGAPTTGFEVGTAAHLVLTGTPAAAGIEFTHRADAAVWLDWRLAALALAPGGQLPH